MTSRLIIPSRTATRILQFSQYHISPVAQALIYFLLTQQWSLPFYLDIVSVLRCLIFPPLYSICLFDGLLAWRIVSPLATLGTHF